MEIEKKQAAEQEGHVQREQRLGFYRKTIYDTMRELDGLEDTEKIIEVFLLTAMGTLGISRGFLFLIDRETSNGQGAWRGLEAAAVSRLQENIPRIMEEYPQADLHEKESSPMTVKLIKRESLVDNPFLPPKTSVLIRWDIDKNYSGLLGLGEMLWTEDYGDDDREFLLSLTHNLMLSVKDAHSRAVIRKLNRELREKGTELEEVLKRTESAQQELNKRVFQLKTLYDISHELSELKDTEKIMETFLLMILGTFSVTRGYILLFDIKEEKAHIACRGLDKESLRTLQEEDIKRIAIKIL
ncbi:MAG: hypothetical protein ABII26_00710 [Pseudomonadota bacterium]